MGLRYGSVCSGIEAASAAWHPLGWAAQFYSEIEAFPSAVLAHHYPDVPNHGDMTAFKDWPDHAIDLLVGGTPCQSFSVAGLRAGLADPRGSLMLTYLAIAARYRPRWVVWENVPGVLSSNGGRDFGTFLGGLGELGYGFAYRVLDAQFCRASGFPVAVPQRRRRVFVVGYLGDWRRAAAVLFDGSSLRGDPAPRRKSGKDVAPTISARPTGGGGLGTDFDLDGGLVADVAGTLNNSGGNAYPGQTLQDATSGQLVAYGGNNTSGAIDASTALNAKSTQRQDFESETLVVSGTLGQRTTDHPNGMKSESDFIVPVAIPFDTTQITSVANYSNPQPGDPSHPMAAGAHVPAIAWSIMPQNSGKDYKTRAVEVAQPIMAGGPVGGNQGGDYIQQQWAVRRLTPTECERLQGFPDGYTAIPYRNKPAADGPRYKALGNSMAVNVMRVLGERIAMVDTIQNLEAAA